MAVEAYCVKCKAKREIKDPKQVTLKNGRNATEGTCPVCGTKLFRMGSGADSKAASGSQAAGSQTSAESKSSSRSKASSTGEKAGSKSKAKAS